MVRLKGLKELVSLLYSPKAGEDEEDQCQSIRDKSSWQHLRLAVVPSWGMSTHCADSQPGLHHYSTAKDQGDIIKTWPKTFQS